MHCGCVRSAHSIEAEPSAVIPMLEKLTLADGASKLTRGDIERLAKYAWYPPGVSYGMVSCFFRLAIMKLTNYMSIVEGGL